MNHKFSNFFLNNGFDPGVIVCPECGNEGRLIFSGNAMSSDLSKYIWKCSADGKDSSSKINPKLPVLIVLMVEEKPALSVMAEDG